MKAVLRMAWRETRATPGRYLFFLLSVAVGVAALVGVKGFGVSLQQAIFREARQLLAADMQATTSKPPTPADLDAIRNLGRLGVESTRVTELVSMAAAPGREDTALVELKAYEPGRYPFYGKLETDPPDVRQADDTVLVAQDLLDRIGLQVGDSLQLGKATFRIAGTVRREPDRVATGFSLGPRVLLTQPGLARTDLVVLGSRARHAFLLKLPDTLAPRQVHEILRPALGQDWNVRDYLEAQPQIARLIDRMVSFLSLVSLVALVAGGLGVAHTTRAFLQQKLDTVAILKCLGASSRAVVGIYLAQALGLGLLGSLLGAALGYGVQALMPSIIGPLLDLEVAVTPAIGPLVQGLLVGTATATLFALVPLLSLTRVPPLLVFRRDLLEQEGATGPAGQAAAAAPGLRGQVDRALQGALGTALRRDEALAAGVAALALGLVAAWQAGNWLWGLYFFGGLTGAAALLGAASWFSLAAVRRAPAPRWVAVRHGLLNLNRPGSQSGSVVLALGLGVTAVATVYLLQTGLLRQVTTNAPAGTPNLALIGIQQNQVQDLTAFLRQHPATLQIGEVTPLVPARLISVDGRGPNDPVPGAPAPAPRGQGDRGPAGEGDGRGSGGGRGFWNRQWTVTWSATLPERTELTAGRWWTAADGQGGAYVSMEEEAAQRLGARLGSELAFEIDGQPVQAKVMSLRRVDWARIGTNFFVIFSPGSLDQFAASYTTFVHTEGSRQPALLRALVDRYPGVTAFDITDILETVQSVLDRVGLVVRFVAAFAMAAGLIILAGGVAATKFRRVREAAILRTLGASRGRVAAVMAVEYAALGSIAGLVGAVLAHLVAAVVMQFVFELTPLVHWGLLALAPFVCAALTVVTGTAAAWDTLTHKPLAVLRGE